MFVSSLASCFIGILILSVVLSAATNLYQAYVDIMKQDAEWVDLCAQEVSNLLDRRSDALREKGASELYEEAHYEGDTRHDATYTVFVRYAVDGVEYEEEYGVFPAMQEGQAITINYNPDDPRDIGQPNSMLLPYGVIAAGVLALAGGVYSIIRVNRKNRAMKKQEEAWKHGKPDCVLYLNF